VSQPHNEHRRPRNRRGQGARLRDELIEAARRLLSTAEQETDVSIRAVAREAGAAPQSFYLQFASLDELLYAVYATEYDALRQAMAQAASEAPDPQARLVAVCTAYCRYAQAQPSRYRALTGVRGQPRHPEWDGRPLPGAPAFALIRDTAAEALASAGSSADPFLAASTLWAALHGLVSLLASRPAFPWPPLADMIHAIAVQTLHTPAQLGGTPESASGGAP
jgi:AcrR family transcriptional regulator